MRQGKSFLLYPTANNRPLLVQEARGALPPAESAQKLNPQINVELVVGQGVFGRLHSGSLRWGTENLGNLGKLRQVLILQAWHMHRNMLRAGADFYPFLPEVGRSVTEEEVMKAANERRQHCRKGDGVAYAPSPLVPCARWAR